MILQAKDVSFSYQKDKEMIWKNLDFTLTQEERLGMIAPSGFGKTTLCKILGGYEKPNSGEVLLDGAPILSIQGYCPVQMIWQNPELAVDPKMRMKDMLAEGDGIEPYILDGLGIEKAWYSRFPGELSGGEIQRFCIARALGKRTRFLLADEISTMMDLITQAQIWNFLLEELEIRKIGLLMISHSKGLLERICGDHIMEL